MFLSQTAVGFRNRPKPLVESLEYPLDEIVIVIWYTGMSENYTFEPDRAHHLLRELVMAGVLDPEQPLSEPNLAYSLAVGRTPVREAIKRTTGEGLVEVRPARGTYIRQITRADVLEIYEVPMASRVLPLILLPNAFGLAEIHRSLHASVHEPLEILDAVEKCEPARARQLICDHLATGLAVRSRIIAQFEYKSNSARAAS